MKKVSMNQQGAWAIAILVAGLGYGVAGGILFKGVGHGEAKDAKEHSGHQTIHADEEADDETHAATGEGHGDKSSEAKEEGESHHGGETSKESGKAKAGHGGTANEHGHPEAEPGEAK